MRAIRFFVTGRVQGVYFRAWTQRRARDLGLTGWVRNLSDGRVEGRAEGEAETIATLERALHEGPPAAQVERVEVEDTEATGAAGFEIRR